MPEQTPKRKKNEQVIPTGYLNVTQAAKYVGRSIPWMRARRLRDKALLAEGLEVIGPRWHIDGQPDLVQPRFFYSIVELDRWLTNRVILAPEFNE
jgi:hypothetical protein